MVYSEQLYVISFTGRLKKGARMADYINWYVFFSGFVIGGICVYSICDLVFNIKDTK